MMARVFSEFWLSDGKRERNKQPTTFYSRIEKMEKFELSIVTKLQYLRRELINRNR
jgi:hypothetical protein